jgi:hypothetical protein
MKVSRPSPAFVVALIALVVAMAGTATAGSWLITNSKQVKAGALTGKNLKNGTVTGMDLAPGSITADKLAPSSALPSAATEVYRKEGPVDQDPGPVPILTLGRLEPGVYAIFGKVTLSPYNENIGLLGELFKSAKTSAGRCVLNAAGDEDTSIGNIISPGSAHPVTMNMQLTRTFNEPHSVKIYCIVDDIVWKASDSSIIAIKLAGSTKTAVDS